MREPSLINAKMQPDGTVVRIPPATDWQAIADELVNAFNPPRRVFEPNEIEQAALAKYHAAKEAQP